MEVLIEICNKALYQAQVATVEHKLEVLDKCTYSGQILIETTSGKLRPFYGLIAANDYEEKYGFRLAVGSVALAATASL